MCHNCGTMILSQNELQFLAVSFFVEIAFLHCAWIFILSVRVAVEEHAKQKPVVICGVRSW